MNQSNAVLMGHPTFSSEANPFSILSCDMSGRLFTFSPELVDLTRAGGGDYSIGDIRSVEFDRIYQEPRFADMSAEVLSGVAQCRNSCTYFPICGGGAPVNKMAENGSFDSTETMFCRYKYKVVADVLDDHVISTIAQRRKQNVLGAPDAAEAYVDDGALAPGFPVLVPLSPASRLLLSDGTGGPQAAPDADRYERQARLPLNSWRPPSTEEMAILEREEANTDSLAFVAVVRPPEQVIAPLLAIASELTSKPIQLRGIDGTVVPIIDEVGAELARLYAEAGRPHRTLGISLVAAGFTTTAVDFSTNRRLGLHVDSGPGSAPRMRAQTLNRISVNLGKEPRRLLFLNLSLAQVIARLPADVGNDPANSPTDLARAFLRAFPRYPVLSLEVEPGEAYIAPTENMIHDGYTGHLTSPDASLSVLGHFRRPGS
jgi:radical SAM protein with 4Fe4S-binding SPASM domain